MLLFLNQTTHHPLTDGHRQCEGLSGRTLRKLPFLAHAFYIQGQGEVGLEMYLASLQQAVTKELSDRAHMT